MRALFLSLFLVFFGTACSSVKVQRDWDQRKASYEFLREKATFGERLGGKGICGFIGLFDFVTDHAPRPTTQCLYPTSAFVPIEGGGGLGTPIKQLKVLQVTPEGILLKSAYPGGRVIFIDSAGQSGLVDNSVFDENGDTGYYEYTGTHSYQTAFGSNTVHAFKKFPADAPLNALKDLKVYNPIDEILADLGQWDQLGENMKRRQGNGK